MKRRPNMKRRPVRLGRLRAVQLREDNGYATVGGYPVRRLNSSEIREWWSEVGQPRPVPIGLG